MIPFLNVGAGTLELEAELQAAMTRVLHSGQYIGGPEVTEFENRFAAYCDAKFAVGVGNGLEALRFALLAMDVGPGDEVIVPSHTYIATWLAVSQTGATPVPVEPAPGLFNIDPAQIEAAITDKTKVIIPVHLYGQPADMGPIMEVARKHGLKVLEDAAQAQGARYKRQRIGAHGDVVAWSFYPGKNLGALGDGGGITTNDAKLAEKIRMLGNYGSREKYNHELPGGNSRLDPLQAAVLSVKLGVLDEWNERRKTIAAAYSDALSDLPFSLPAVPNFADPVWHLYVIRTEQRQALADHLLAAGVQTVTHYPRACFEQPAYQEFSDQASRFPDASKIAAEVLSLPISPHQSEEATDHIVKSVRNFFEKGNKS
ncbi:DegT/DnrJ/EryC1/StrS family aminotransferase [Thalassobius sp. I31.1]|uniref:DegT/DnrJ/EryC1/StrS family aminotransferase n=1 Tax=Thalassobius sp. I31.1 TaxID=2109912 RepID=UPI000D1AFFCB|nr:DegT/DnrJ/EryC1/StrS family aminotransferase [Thalassobius sp. I31.1]